MHQCARLSCVAALGAHFAGLHWLHWLHWSQTRRSDGVSAAAFLHWIYQGVWPIVDTLVLLVAHAYVCLVLASVFKAAS